MLEIRRFLNPEQGIFRGVRKDPPALRQIGHVTAEARRQETQSVYQGLGIRARVRAGVGELRVSSASGRPISLVDERDEGPITPPRGSPVLLFYLSMTRAGEVCLARAINSKAVAGSHFSL